MVATRSPPCHERHERGQPSKRCARSCARPPRPSPTGPTPWRASSSAWSTTSTAPCASRWRSSPSAITRPPRRSPWRAACVRSSRRSCTGAVRGHGSAPDRTAQLQAPGRGPGVRDRGRRFSRRLGTAVGGRCLDHRGLGGVPGDRLRAGHPWRGAGPGRPLLGPRLPVGRPRRTARRAGRPGGTTRRGGGRAARRRGRRGDRRPAAALRGTRGASAAPRSGAPLVGVVAPVRGAAARRRRSRHIPPGHVPHRQPLPAPRPR